MIAYSNKITMGFYYTFIMVYYIIIIYRLSLESDLHNFSTNSIFKYKDDTQVDNNNKMWTREILVTR